MRKLIINTVLFTLCAFQQAYATDVPIINYSVDSYGCVQIQVNSSSKYYYVLHCKPKPNDSLEWAVSIKKGQEGTTTLSEGLKAYPVENYRVSQHLIAEPADIDGDGINDIDELADIGRLAPLNGAPVVNTEDGVVCIPNSETFESLSYKQGTTIKNHRPQNQYIKFSIFLINTKSPHVYFINTDTYKFHREFFKSMGFDYTLDEIIRGKIIYYPLTISPYGKLGVYAFEFGPLDSYPFKTVQRCYELLASNMPFLRNNWTYYPPENKALPKYRTEKELYNNSRVAVILNSDIYRNVNYLPLNQKEGYGKLKLLNEHERPNARDIVLYKTLPNELSRVGGIITSEPQTPLSHVNLRAMQDNVPNAYIARAHKIRKIADLIGKYVFYKVKNEDYELRPASLAEVEQHYEKLRPKETQYLNRNLSIKKIRPLKKINFDNSSSFGVKAANIATMLKFDFPEEIIPNGYAVPFNFYDKFMKYNNFYTELEKMLADTNFVKNYDVQEKMLAEFRDSIRNAQMPKWMIKALSKMQKSFSPGTSVRCRSSTNNEDLPGFSGAGLYTSKTQKPEEGNISKSIKQVYASLWNFRAFDERQFYRIDHFSVAMGVLCHPNYTNEQANGVAVANDPVYGTKNTYYLNTQIGEDLVTNPESLSIPEEVLLNSDSEGDRGYTLIQTSNLTNNKEKLLSDEHLDQLRKYLTIIQNNFKKLYKTSDQSNFAMEIEYKITSENKLIIKQARPWVTDPVYKSENNSK